MTAELKPHQALPRLPIGGTDVQVRIADVAIRLFYARGAFSTTVRDITAACRLTPGALYNHFASKEDLLYVLIRDIHVLADADLAAVIAEAEGDPARQLAGAVRVLITHAVGQRERSRVANREFVALTESRRKEVVGIRRKLRDRVTSVLETGIQQGDFELIGSQDHAAAALTANVIATMCSNISEWTTTTGSLTLPDLQDRYVEMALRLVGTRVHSETAV
jgi:TetR/AcrR family transcriptional regulator, cholesterol catabolism regulator